MPHTDSWKATWKPPEKIEHGVPTKWNWVVLYPDKLAIGRYVDIGAFTLLNADAGIVLEDEVEIGSHCALHSVSTIDEKWGRIIVERGAKIGSHTVVMPGITIGRNATIGAHSFVNCDIPDDAICFGIPARVKR